MRLIDVATLRLEAHHNPIPPYAILSHTWEEEEVLFEEYGTPQVESKKGYAKILGFCKFAADKGHSYVWVDTCCIDKRSSAELSEAINSMCAWYEAATTCYVFLSDVAAGTPEDAMFKSRWWTRGWTLQEIIAPRVVVFLDSGWNHVCEKFESRREIARYTGIEESALKSLQQARHCSVASRMSWAADRMTTRSEDRAYSLLGLFNTHMPLLYGEGESKAFLRLQEEILKSSSDQSILAWDLASDTASSFEIFDIHESEGDVTSLDTKDLSWDYTFEPVHPLATSPSAFRNSRHVAPVPVPASSVFGMTNQGLSMELPNCQIGLMFSPTHYYVALLACSNDSFAQQNVWYCFILLSSDPTSKVFSRLLYRKSNWMPTESTASFWLDLRVVMGINLLKTPLFITTLNDTTKSTGLGAYPNLRNVDLLIEPWLQIEAVHVSVWNGFSFHRNGPGEQREVYNSKHDTLPRSLSRFHINSVSGLFTSYCKIFVNLSEAATLVLDLDIMHREPGRIYCDISKHEHGQTELKLETLAIAEGQKRTSGSISMKGIGSDYCCRVHVAYKTILSDEQILLNVFVPSAIGPGDGISGS